MLSPEENVVLTQVEPGTPLNELFRRFWLPVLLADELPQPGSPPVRVRVLGEDLVAFRDTEDRIGFLDRRCPHRLANLFWGRNESGGLRCAYHGWLFDVTGVCIDIPNAPEGASYREKVQAFAAYPGVEAGGLVWVYMGPPGAAAQLPELEFTRVPAERRFIRKMILPGNYLQIMEGDVDSSHLSFLHSAGIPDRAGMLAGASSPYMKSDRAPRWTVSETPYGIRLAARRNAEADSYYWRVNQWLIPAYTMIAARWDDAIHINIRVPQDDQHTIYFRLWWHPDRPFSEGEREEMETGGVLMPEIEPGTFQTVERMENDYLIDREKQRSGASFTGIKSVSAQDFAMQEDQGGLIADRSLEHLVSSDTAIIAIRHRLLGAVNALQEGREPPETGDGSLYRVRSLDMVLPRDVPVEVGGARYMIAKV